MDHFNQEYFSLRTSGVQKLIKGKTNYFDRWGLIWLVLFMSVFILVSLRYIKFIFNYRTPAKLEIRISQTSNKLHLSGNALILKDKSAPDGALMDLYLKLKGNRNETLLKCRILSVTKFDNGEYCKINFECDKITNDLKLESINNEYLYLVKSVSLSEFSLNIIEKK